MTYHPGNATLPMGTARSETIQADVCVVGGGMSGICAAIAAARHGATVVLLQDRHVLGGNASSEIRMWICGAHGKDNKETGILEEIQLENCWRNPQLNYPVWDTVLYEKVAFEPNIDLRLSCAVVEVEMHGDQPESGIHAVKAWHLTAQHWLRVEAKQFIDCSGDSILRLSGAPTRWGREAQSEFNEDLAPVEADRKTMGNSLLLQLREIDPADHRPFTPPAWARTFSHEEEVRPWKPTGHNFWWLELGGMVDTQADADKIRDELYALAFGVWDVIKNHPDGRGHRWELEWIGSLPGKRENIRFEGDHILTQHDVDAGGQFDDIVAYGGWTMDDHPPGGFDHKGAPTQHHKAPSPYGIPYRCLFSKSVPNLLFAGRNISATHMALSSTRVMATCALLGQAVGTAAALCIAHQTTPRGVYEDHINELQVRLADDDQYLPGRRRPATPAMEGATLTASTDTDTSPLLDGHERHLGDDAHAWIGPVGSSLTFTFPEDRQVDRLRLVGDSQLHRVKRMPCNYPMRGHDDRVPPPLLRHARIEALQDDGSWQQVGEIKENRRRLIVVPLNDVRTKAIRLTLDESWGGEEIRLFAAECGSASLNQPLITCAWPIDVGKGGKGMSA